eukprot:5628354-Amphidinium_carterae.1
MAGFRKQEQQQQQHQQANHICCDLRRHGVGHAGGLRLPASSAPMASSSTTMSSAPSTTMSSAPTASSL